MSSARTRSWIRASILVVTVAGTLASCGGSAASPFARISTPTAAGRFGTRPPRITVGSAPPPTVLQVADLIDGTGRAVRDGDTVTVQYVEVSYSAPGTVVQQTWGQAPLSFTVGGTEVIKGWSEGMVGMKVGGRREIIVPPDLAYSSISDATVVLVVDLLRFGAPATTTTVAPLAGTIKVADLGAPLTLTATQATSTGSNVVSGPTPPLLTTDTLEVTVDRVIDPAPSTLGPTPPMAGDRPVAVTVTVTNRGSVPFTDVDPLYGPPLAFAADSATFTSGSGELPLASHGYGADTSDPFPTIAPGATATDDVVLALPVGIPVVNASATLRIGNSPIGSLGEWLVPPAPHSGTTTSTTTPVPPSSTFPVPTTAPPGAAVVPTPTRNVVAHVGGTLTLTASYQLSTGPEHAAVDVTFDRVIDPAPGSPYGAPTAAAAHDRWVELQFTMTNVGNVTVPWYQGDEYALSLAWDVNDLLEFGGFLAQSNACGGSVDRDLSSAGLLPGTTTTGCLPVELPEGVPVVSASTTLMFAGVGDDDTTAQWSVP